MMKENTKNQIIETQDEKELIKLNEKELIKFIEKNSIFEIFGHIRDYSWGGDKYISKILNINSRKIAEYWLGTHYSACANVKFQDQYIPLKTIIEKNEKFLNKSKIKELPFLFKILDVKTPLSIQLHPDKSQAELGFKSENMKNIKLNAENRIFKDENDKSELMIALSDFYLLHGFQNIDKTLMFLKTRPLLKKLYDMLKEYGLKITYSTIMNFNNDELIKLIGSHIKYIQNKYKDKLHIPNEEDLSDPDYWVVFTLSIMKNLDSGIISFYLFNLVKLKPNEGIFQNANVPHSYLRGQNIEIMTASDNVIRGGLTQKYINVEMLLKYISYQEIMPNIICTQNKNIMHYPVPVSNFNIISIIFKKSDTKEFQAVNALIIFVLCGEILIYEKDKMKIRSGQSLFVVPSTNFKIESIIKSQIYISSF